MKAAARMSLKPFTVNVTRRFRQPPERVFDAWIDASMVPGWFAPGLGPVTRVEIDARVGGRFNFTQQREGEDVIHVGEYLAVDRPRHLAFTWATPQFSDDVSTVSIEIVPDGTGSHLSLTQEMDPKWKEYADRTESGWKKILDGIAAVA